MMGKQGTWRQSIASLAISALILLTFRWVIFEPYVIPSGSMLPTLKILDFIYVNKFSYGLRLPFSSKWVFERDLPKRCDVVVFRSPTEPGIFLIKRVMGLPGEHVELFQSGRVRIDGRLLETTPVALKDDARKDGDTEHLRFREDCGGGRTHLIQVAPALAADAEDAVDPLIYSIQVPSDHLILFGDNRHESADSRVWGSVSRTELLGEALGIWLSCESALPGLPRLCDPSTLRTERIFTRLDREER